MQKKRNKNQEGEKKKKKETKALRVFDKAKLLYSYLRPNMPCIAKVQERRTFCLTCKRISRFVFNTYSDFSGKTAMRKEGSTKGFCISQEKHSQKLSDFLVSGHFYILKSH